MRWQQPQSAGARHQESSLNWIRSQTVGTYQLGQQCLTSRDTHVNWRLKVLFSVFNPGKSA